MAKVYDPATGHEVRELSGRFAGTKYLVDSSGKYVSNLTSMDAGVNYSPNSSSGVENSGGVANASGSGVNTSGSGVNTFGSGAAVAAAPVLYNGPDYSGAISTGFADVANAFGDAGTDRMERGRANTTGQAALNTLAVNRENLAAGDRSQMGTDLTSGFRDMTGRFNAVDTNVGNVQGAVDRGFVDQAAGFSDAQTNRDAQFRVTGEALDNGFGATTTQLTEAQAAVLKGQTGLGTTLQTIGDTADIYAGQSLDNQAAMQSGIDTQASTFDNYIDRYSDDTQFAQDNRRDLASAQSNFADEMSTDVALYNTNRGRDFELQQQQLAAIRDQQLSDAAAAAEASYRSGLSRLELGSNAQSGNLVPAGLGSPFAVTQ